MILKNFFSKFNKTKMNNTNRLEEPLLTDDNSRFTQLPLKYPLLQKAFETHESMFWSAKEIPYSDDVNDWESLSDNERFFIENILGFLAMLMVLF